MKTCCFYFQLQRGVFFIGCFYIGVDIFRLCFHLMVLYFPFDFGRYFQSLLRYYYYYILVHAWYIPQRIRRRRSEVIFERYEDDVQQLVSTTLYRNPAQIIIILCLDLVTDCFIIIGTKHFNVRGVISSLK